MQVEQLMVFMLCFNTQPPEGGWAGNEYMVTLKPVSTHSRLKAAGQSCRRFYDRRRCFNTQPPEGGWAQGIEVQIERICFNTQPPEGGWSGYLRGGYLFCLFQHTAA